MKRDIRVVYKNFKGVILTTTLRGFEGKLNPEQIKKKLDECNIECYLVMGWSICEFN